MTATAITHPLDTLRLRLALPNSGFRGRHAVCMQCWSAIARKTRECNSSPTKPPNTGMSHALRGIVAAEGPWALYRGLGPALVGVAPYAALNFSAYDLLKSWLYDGGRCEALLHVAVVVVVVVNHRGWFVLPASPRVHCIVIDTQSHCAIVMYTALSLIRNRTAQSSSAANPPRHTGHRGWFPTCVWVQRLGLVHRPCATRSTQCGGACKSKTWSTAASCTLWQPFGGQRGGAGTTGALGAFIGVPFFCGSAHG